MVRQLGTDLITLAGGQFIHPVKAVVGGISSGGMPITEKAAAFQKQRYGGCTAHWPVTWWNTYWDISMHV